jgi:hypothetical protein
MASQIVKNNIQQLLKIMAWQIATDNNQQLLKIMAWQIFIGNNQQLSKIINDKKFDATTNGYLSCHSQW